MALTGCTICSKEFYIKPSHQKLGWGKYCSRDCMARGQLRGRKMNCFICKKETYKSPKSIARSKSGKFFCSKSCQTYWRNTEYIEKKSANWKTGRAVYRAILMRSNLEQACALCKTKDFRVLAAHHKDHNRSNNHLANLTWLCFNCHYLVHHDKQLEKRLLEMLV